MYQVKLLHGPYESNGKVRHKPQRLYGLLGYLKKNDYDVEIVETTLINRLTVEMKGREIFRCDIRNLKFNAECDDDVVCLRIIASIEEARERFYSDLNVPKFASVKEGMRYVKKFQSFKTTDKIKSDILSESIVDELFEDDQLSFSRELMVQSYITPETEGDILCVGFEDDITHRGSEKGMQIERTSTEDTHMYEINGEDSQTDELYKIEDEGEFFLENVENGSGYYDEETLGEDSREKNEGLSKIEKLEPVSRLLDAVEDKDDEDRTIFQQRKEQVAASDDKTSSNHVFIKGILDNVLEIAAKNISVDDDKDESSHAL